MAWGVIRAAKGVLLGRSSATLGPITAPGEYHADVIVLNGDQVVAYLRAPAGPPTDVAAITRMKRL
jgi:hypothetical protein